MILSKKHGGVVLEAKHLLSGHFRLTAVKTDGSGERELADFHNTILDQGLDWVFTNTNTNASFHQFAQVGSSSSPEDPSQTSLGARVAWVRAAGTSNEQLNWTSLVVVTEPRFEIRCVKTIRFGAGAAAGNIAEVAVGWGSGLNNIFCRALVRDENGDPTTVQVAADEYLDVTYTLTVVVDTADKLFTLNLASGVHEGVLRPAQVNSSYLSHASFLRGGMHLNSLVGSLPAVSNGAVGPVTGSISGTKTFTTNTSGPQPYVPGSFYRDTMYSLGLSAGNITGGVSAWELNFGSWHWYQAQFTPPIPKTPDKIFTVRLRISLARA